MPELVGLRALVVEDEGGVALLIEDMLEALGCKVAVSAASLPEALKAATAESFDFAVLDVNLNGEFVFPVAAILQRRQKPFLFSTGYGRIGIPPAYKDAIVLGKPFMAEELERKLRSMLTP